jgi:hypothetical protein
MVEALAAGATGGGSLSTVVHRLTFGFVNSQFANTPKTVLTLLAEDGLAKSLDAYKQLDSFPLPPADATALIASDLVRIKSLYLQARTLELPYSALAAQLMPKSGQELTEAALKSAVSELGSVAPSSNPSASVTLKDLLTLHTTLTQLAKPIPALHSYSDIVHLALELNAAGSNTISKWAAEAAKDCSSH